MKIVIIEDEDMLSSVQYALQGKGVKAEGLGALDEQVKKLEPDVILMDKSVKIGSFIFTPASKTLERNGEVIRLSIYQNKLLYLLCACMNITVTREEITRMLWPDVIVIDQSLNNLISQLRKLLSADPHIHIDTIRGVGYRLRSIAKINSV